MIKLKYFASASCRPEVFDPEGAIVVNPKSYHKPHVLLPLRARCPVCKEAVYSPAGIHPQCAMAHPDVPVGGWGVFDQMLRMPGVTSEGRAPADRGKG
jgi:hypothetical protein